MSYVPTIVVDDDNEEVLRNFRWERENSNVNIIPFKTWDKTEEYLSGGNIVDAIVLDARGQITADDDVGDHHIFEALQYVKNAKIPYVIYTAHSEEELGLLKKEYQQGKVFEKTGTKKKTPEEVIGYLKTEIVKSPLVKLRNKYEPAFQPFYKDIIGKEYEHNLIELLFCLQDEDYKKKNLNVVRDVLESVFLSLINKYKIIPIAFKNSNSKPNLEWCTRYLEGRVTNDDKGVPHTLEIGIPSHIQFNFRYIKNLSSAFSHLSENAEIKNAFISTTHSVLEILEWLPGFINEHFE
jgi:hypothetical protein